MNTCGVCPGLYCGSAHGKVASSARGGDPAQSQGSEGSVLRIYGFLQITQEAMETGLQGNPFLSPGLLSNKLCALSQG